MRKRVLSITLSALIIIAFVFLFERSVVNRVSGVQTIGVGVYWGQNCSNAVTSIDWGVLNPGAVKNTIVYVRNEGEQPVSLTMSPTNWIPSIASNYIRLTWDYSGRLLKTNEVLKTTLTLSVSSNASNASSFNFSLVISGAGSSDQYSLTVNYAGSGSVTKSPNQASYASGTVVTLTAVPAAGSSFTSWSGGLTGNTNPTTITMNSNKTVTATFTSPNIFEDGFESANFGNWSGTSATSGETRNVVNLLCYRGKCSGRFTSNGGGGTEYAFCYKNVASLAEVYARAYFYTSESGIANDGDRFYVIALKAAGNGVAYAGWRKSAGVVKWCLLVKDGTSSVVAYSTASTSLNKWYCVELHWKENSTNGLAEMWVDGTLVCSAAGKNTAAFGDVSQAQFGLVALYGCGNTTAYCDCAKIATTYIGPEPTINSFTVSPNPFSPNGDGANDATTIKATFNVVVSWTLQARNASGGLMRRWEGNSSSLSVIWDGKSSLGTKVPDGSYNLTLAGSGQSGISLTSKTIQVVVDTKPPTVMSISISPTSFSPRTGQTTKINYTLSESSYVTIKVYNSTGTLIRTLVNSALQTGGAKSVTWNGKTSSGTAVSTGTYTIKISVADKAGNKATPYPINKTVKVT
jgi:flagellar hook assembly protein FlgD